MLIVHLCLCLKNETAKMISSEWKPNEENRIAWNRWLSIHFLRFHFYVFSGRCHEHNALPFLCIEMHSFDSVRCVFECMFAIQAPSEKSKHEIIIFPFSLKWRKRFDRCDRNKHLQTNEMNCITQCCTIQLKFRRYELIDTLNAHSWFNRTFKLVEWSETVNSIYLIECSIVF